MVSLAIVLTPVESALLRLASGSAPLVSLADLLMRSGRGSVLPGNLPEANEVLV